MTATAQGTDPRTDSTLLVATSAEDAAAADAIRDHHEELMGRLDNLVGAVLAARDDREAQASRDDLVAFARGELLPHALAEEPTLYALAARTERATMLIEAMVTEHHTLAGLVDAVARAPRHTETVAAAAGMQTLFTSHVAAENDLILPLLAGDKEVSLAAALIDMQQAFAAAKEEAGAAGATAEEGCDSAGHACGCHEPDPTDLVLDVREVPHKIRHATVFGAYDAVPPGRTLVLVAPHDPLPLLRQLAQRDPHVEVSYEERGPDAWRLRLRRGSGH